MPEVLDDKEMVPATAKELERKLKDIQAVMNYIHAGKATFTVRSKVTGTRFTYRVVKPKKETHNPHFGPYDDNKWLVKVLYGPDNNTMYRFFGFIRRHIDESVAYPGVKLTSWKFEASNNYKFQDVVKSQHSKAFAWMYNMVIAGKYPEAAEIWHSGTCGACGRLLTVPESIEAGIGPICASK